MSLFKTIGKSALIIASFVVGSALQAKTLDHIDCPSLDKIRGTASLLDTVIADNNQQGKFIAFTSSPAFNQSDIPWRVGAAGIAADNQNEVLMLGRKAVSNVSQMYSQKAEHMGENVYFCIYFGDDVMETNTVVGAIGGDIPQIPNGYWKKFTR